jgi:ribosome-binding ATPase YchF (GTP1/OBG family)
MIFTAKVVRCFDDEEIIHVEQTVGKLADPFLHYFFHMHSLFQYLLDPVRDMAIIESELILSDLESTEKLKNRLSSKKKGGSKAESSLLLPDVVDVVLPLLEEGLPASLALPGLEKKGPEHLYCFEALNLLSAKPGLLP